MDAKRLDKEFFLRDVVEVATDLPGKILVRRFDDGVVKRYRITETEAYRGEEDLACHASKGRTSRTEVMYHEGGKVYVYFIYGMYWLLNLVTGNEGNPSAVLIRGIEGFNGPGRVGKALKLDKSFYGEQVDSSERLWIEDDGCACEIKTGKRIGVDYAGKEWAERQWRFIVCNNKLK
jgi:DNA-3-methyladenine glycosylase